MSNENKPRYVVEKRIRFQASEGDEIYLLPSDALLFTSNHLSAWLGKKANEETGFKNISWEIKWCVFDTHVTLYGWQQGGIVGNFYSSGYAAERAAELNLKEESK